MFVDRSFDAFASHALQWSWPTEAATKCRCRCHRWQVERTPPSISPIRVWARRGLAEPSKGWIRAKLRTRVRRPIGKVRVGINLCISVGLCEWLSNKYPPIIYFPPTFGVLMIGFSSDYHPALFAPWHMIQQYFIPLKPLREAKLIINQKISVCLWGNCK